MDPYKFDLHPRMIKEHSIILEKKKSKTIYNGGFLDIRTFPNKI